jgi:cytochrome c oxidase assembly protein subunit 15
MKELKPTTSNHAVAWWVLIGVVMLMIQVLLGGITRLTGSGLSITEWKPILGALPPMNDSDWSEAFEKYKQIAQYKQLNSFFDLADFKSIYFWEWLHRLWARLIAVAFVIPFAFFIFKKMIKKEMINGLIILFLLGLLQGLVGWIMVMSGLEDSELVYVSHYKLAIHFILAMGIICYALWFALQLLVPKEKLIVDSGIRKYYWWLMALLTLQLIYGAFMAGLKAGPYAATWPDINGKFFPDYQHHLSNIAVFDNPYIVHFIHRGLAYIVAFTVLYGWWKFRSMHPASLFSKSSWLLPGLTLLQVVLGIFTVLNSTDTKTLVWLGTAHQFVAMLLLLSLVWVVYIVRSKAVVNS